MNKKVCVYSTTIIVMMLFCVQIVYARTIGSNSLVSRQKEVYFNAQGTNNKLLGFSVFEEGIILQDNTTVCDVDFFFPLSG